MTVSNIYHTLTAYSSTESYMNSLPSLVKYVLDTFPLTDTKNASNLEVVETTLSFGLVLIMIDLGNEQNIINSESNLN